MSNAGVSQKNGGTPPGRAKKRGALANLLLTLAVALLILLVFGLLAARTEGFRAYAQETLREKTGSGLLVGKTKIGWPYDLVLENVRLDRKQLAGDAGLSVREVRLGVRWDVRLHVILTGCNLALQKNADGRWEPDLVEPLGSLNSVAEVSRLATNLPARVQLEVRDALVEWLDASGDRKAFAKGVGFVMTPLILSGRQLYHCRLQADEVLRTSGGRLYDVERDWLCGEARPYLEIVYKADSQRPADGADFWSRPSDGGSAAPAAERRGSRGTP